MAVSASTAPSCNMRENGRRRYGNPPTNLVEEYFDSGSLTGLRQKLNLNCSEKTVHRWLVSQLRNYPTWKDFLPEMAKHVEFSYVMGIDTTVLSIAGKRCHYLHVVDFPDNHIAYEILESRDAESIKMVLLKIKALTGYEPRVIVTDRAKELLQAARDVYPKAIIQGCLFHLRDWLDKRLPTKKIGDPDKIREWDSVKSLVMRAALAIDYDEKNRYLSALQEKLLSKSADKNVRNTIRDFLKDADYYHPLRELMVFGCRPEWRYNNVCERAMKSVKDLSREMHGFKRLDLTRRYINAMWIIKMRKKMGFLSGSISEEKDSEALTLPLTLFTYDRYIDLRETARAYNISMDMLRSRIEAAGYIVAGDVAFGKDYLDIVMQKVLSDRPKTLKELMNLTSLDFNTSIRAAEALRLKIMYYSPADPQRIFLGYDRLVTNETDHT